MLRKLIVNKRNIPVPVPLMTLGEVVQWLSDTLVLQGHTITRLSCNGADIDFSATTLAASVGSADVIDVRIDSPSDLAVQILETLSNLASVVVRSIKSIAVRAWETPPGKVPEGLPDLHGDIELVAQLLEHFDGLVLGVEINTTNMHNLSIESAKGMRELAAARSSNDWRTYAKVLLNKFEVILSDLAGECESVEAQILASRAEKKIAKIP